MTSGSSQAQPGKAIDAAVPDNSKDSGKPAAIATRRQKVPASALRPAPAAVASAIASQAGQDSRSIKPYKNQLPPQAIKAGKGQRSSNVEIAFTARL